MDHVVSEVHVTSKEEKYIHILTGQKKVTFEDEANKTDEEKALEKLNDEAYDD